MTEVSQFRATTSSRLTKAGAYHESTSHGIADIVDAKANVSISRSVIKSLSWRALGSIDTLVLGYIFSGSLTIAGSIASTEVLTKVTLYYLHERGWAHIKWGRQ
jgi:uncharacterized membrane protein